MDQSRFGSRGVLDCDRSRRRFVQGLAAGACVLAGPPRGWGGVPLASGQAADSVREDPGSVLRGTDIHLEIGACQVNFTGKRRSATVVNGRLPAPQLYLRQGDTVTIRVSNSLTVPTSIHWHGMIVPADMDGVPGISFNGIPPGAAFVYRFQLRQAGTYWYHSHSRFQEQIGLYGPIVIQPAGGERQHADREHVLLLSDWTDLDPEHIYRLLKVQSDYFNYGRRTVPEFFADVRREGFAQAMAERAMWGRMRMNATDLLDVSGHAYTYLLNGTTPTGNWTGLFRRGERVRLRIINGSSMSFFDVRIPGLPLTVIAADGQDVEPLTVDEFRIGAAEVYDVLVEPKDDRAYTIFAQALDASGYARGTLAPAPGLTAGIPPLDPRPNLSMADMGMSAADDRGSMAMDRAHMGMSPMAMNHMGHGSVPGHPGPNVDSIVPQPTTRLDDPGVGLRSSGRRVLTYADLHTIGGPLDAREPSREIRLHLTGHMQRFVWSFDGHKFSDSQPLRFNYGERLRVVLVNDSMMTHPIHLHGMWSEVESADGQFLVRKHTVVVQPGQQLSYGVSANALGRWAFHCHLLYHMEAGMFREVVVAQGEGSDSQS